MTLVYEPLKTVRHESLYLPDGDVVLAAPQAPTTTVLFRVDKIYLSRNSPAFRSMFSLPSVPSVNELYDGVPKVQLPDDADDLARLLAALYDPTTLTLERFNPDTPLLMTGVTRLATKYEIDTIRTLIVKHIEADWPHTLEEWDAYQAERNSASHAYFNSKDRKIKGKYIDDVYPEPVAAIRFALEFDVPSILPAAWYQLAITDAKLYLDYDTVHAHPHMRLCSHPCSRKARWKLLQTDAALLTVTLFGKAKLEEYMKVAEHIIRNSALACEDSHRCEQSGTKKAREFLALFSPPADPLWGIQQVLTGALWDVEMCAECILYKESLLRRARQTIWDALPLDFQLPVWEVETSVEIVQP